MTRPRRPAGRSGARRPPAVRAMAPAALVLLGIALLRAEQGGFGWAAIVVGLALVVHLLTPEE